MDKLAKKEVVDLAKDTLKKALLDERNDFIDEMEARRVYAEQDEIIKSLEEKYAGRNWIRECFKNERLVIREGVSRGGVRGFIAVDENTGVIVSAFKTKESVENDLKKRTEKMTARGRPEEMEGGKRVQAYLDAESIAIATKLGNGNVSEGIRKALKQAS